jgi:hypothetical protein
MMMHITENQALAWWLELMVVSSSIQVRVTGAEELKPGAI